MNIKKVVVFVLAVLMIVMMFGACTTNKPEDEETPGAETPTGDVVTEPGDTEERYNVVALLWSRGFEFMVALDQGIKDKAEELGIDIVVLDGQANSQTQIAQIEDNISKGVDAIILAPNNSDELVAGVKLANNAGIPVITVDSIVSEGAEIASGVAFDNEAGGKVAAETIQKLLPDGGVALECTGATGYYHAVKRGGGFNLGMEGSNFDVITKDCQWSAENAQNAVVDIISSNSAVNAIMTHNDEMIRGVVSGLKQIDKQVPVGEDGHIVVVGVDGTPIALDLIRNGEIDATIQQDPFEMGALAVDVTLKVLKGESVEKQYYVYPKVIDKTNVDDPTNWGNIMSK